MEDSAMKVLLASVSVSFALGFGMAWYIQTPGIEAATVDVATAVPAPGAASGLNQFGDLWSGSGQAPATAPSSPARSATVDELWARALLPPDRQEPGYDAEDKLRKLAQSDPAALRNLLARYGRTESVQARDLLKSVLSTVQSPEVLAFSNRLANSSNIAERKYGFEMLQSLAPDSAETRSLVKRTLATEQSPEVLVQALGTLQSVAVEPEESETMVAQLKNLSQHADPGVRSQSIMHLGQWDKKGENAERLSQALTDQAPEVRHAAIFAIAQTGVRSDAVKAALMGLVNNAQESKDVRGSALQTLERFSLSKEEYASFAQARAQVLGM